MTLQNTLRVLGWGFLGQACVFCAPSFHDQLDGVFVAELQTWHFFNSKIWICRSRWSIPMGKNNCTIVHPMVVYADIGWYMLNGAALKGGTSHVSGWRWEQVRKWWVSEAEGCSDVPSEKGKIMSTVIIRSLDSLLEGTTIHLLDKKRTMHGIGEFYRGKAAFTSPGVHGHCVS